MKFRAGSRRRAGVYERELAEWWRKNGIFEQSVVARPETDAYVFYDGPPFITGSPHHGTLLSSIVKDAVPRFWTMRGKRCERRWGWDCHGLPAENFVEKQLGITDRREIGTKWSLEDYITKARESMVANSESWEATIERIGRWVDLRGAYRTMDRDYMESVWWAFKTLYDAGKIYEGRKVLMYDTKFATPVSKAEVTMDNDAYQTVTDPSAYVKFKITRGDTAFFDDLAKNTASSAVSAQNAVKNTETGADRGETKAVKAEKSGKTVGYFLLAWTTTPWTLPANLCLAVNPELEYGVFAGKNSEQLILTTGVGRRLFPEQTPSKIFKGKQLKNLHYEPIIENLPDGATGKDTYTVVTADFVTDESGTGIVHIAPAYGEDDYALTDEYDLDFADVVDANGYYLPEMAEKLHALGVRDTDENGIEIWAGNKFIAKCLEAEQIIYSIEYIRHEYPFNPRSKQRIMYRAFPSWFFDIQGSKPLMLAENENINWFPRHLKHGRFAKNIEQAPDWNLSRDRFWATAMPVWKGDKGSVKVVGSYDELFELSGVRLEDYHRPWVDAVEFDLNGEHFRRIDKVLDCWFESGSMPFAQMHYPFENREKFEANYPADFIVEYVGQVRAWFYYLHAVNTALAEVGAFGQKARQGEKNAFKNVITTGTLAGSDGRKMSKSLGNFTDPNELMDKFSADSLRFLLLSSPVLAGEDFALLDKDVSDVARKLAGIWNVFDFFATYAEVDGFEWPMGENDENSQKFGKNSEEPAKTTANRRKAAKIAENSQKISKNPQKSSKNAFFGGFADGKFSVITDLTGVKNPLDRWIISEIHILNTKITQNTEKYDLPSALAGVLPFADDLSNWFVRRSRRRFWKSEDDTDKTEAYGTLAYVLTYLSLLLAPFVPFLAEELYQQMTGARALSEKELVRLGLKRSVHLCDWPEAGATDADVTAQMARTRRVITETLSLRMRKSETEAQVKVRQPLAELVFAYADAEVDPETDELMGLPAEYARMIADEVNVKKVTQVDTRDFAKLQNRAGWVASENGELQILLDKNITPELAREGFARELIRAVQAARKQAGLAVDDRIRLRISGAEGPAEIVPVAFAEVVKAETLAVELSTAGNYAYDEIATVAGQEVVISLEKA